MKPSKLYTGNLYSDKVAFLYWLDSQKAQFCV